VAHPPGSLLRPRTLGDGKVSPGILAHDDGEDVGAHDLVDPDHVWVERHGGAHDVVRVGLERAPISLTKVFDVPG